MRRVLACLLAVFSAAAGWAAGSVTITGTIQTANPGATYETSVLPSAGITRNLSACDDQGEWQGFDGSWVNVAAYRGWDALLRPALAMPAGYAVDFDVYFYDAACRFVSYFRMAEGNGGRFGFGLPEDGTIPDEATWSQVTMWTGPPGAEYEYTFTPAS